jgi:hypothetical protein
MPWQAIEPRRLYFQTAHQLRALIASGDMAAAGERWCHAKQDCQQALGLSSPLRGNER